ncbi:hydroxyacid dehydrogenase [Rhizobium sp. T1470]|uniref:D-3-phosphoglycerate dehydrogenase n=2 Tax=Rhizobium/Agrobacterium group TaxID=227290 RepID=W6RH11_9HYPH|nr:MULTISPECIES: hydroxyacid dehydrogenase [Rhizobium]MCA0803670.1 hydroxyacid dehydrogenase [Rhizobium sp. T1473]MCS0459414.1 hydroxyacid dehydrogenase [Rhizobium favelukesii]CDM59655.1 D-3-phosphoglycerate dehydrogenase [Rhizobium favelukesii]
MEKTVVILGGELAAEGRALLEEAGASVIATPPYVDRQAVVEIMKAYKPDAVIVRLLADLLGPEEMQAGGKLRHIAKHGVGTNDIDVKAATALGIPVSMTTGSNGHSVAEHALALIMALVKDLPRQDALIRDGIWDKNQYRGRELRGQRLGLVGFGFIGQTLARMAGAIGLIVSAFDPHTPDSAFHDGVCRETDLDTLLANSDIVSLHCPLTSETQNLIDARRIGLMKQGAFLINTARGEVVDENALIAALEEGHLAGAGLDSFAVEPPGIDNPLFQLSNTLVTPHVAGVTLDAKRAVSIMAAENVLAAFDGRTLEPRFLAR